MRGESKLHPFLLLRPEHFHQEYVCPRNCANKCVIYLQVPNKRCFVQLSLEIPHVIDAYTMSSIYMKYFKLVHLIKRRNDHK